MENQSVSQVSLCWFCSKKPANPQSVITEKKLAKSTSQINNWNMKTQETYNVAQIPRCKECEAFHQRVAKAGIPAFFHELQQGNDAQYSRPMHMRWWYGCNVFFASGALVTIFFPINSVPVLGFLSSLLIVAALTLLCGSYVKKIDSIDAFRSRFASGLLNATYFSIYLFALGGSRIMFGPIIVIYLIWEIFRGIQINRVRSEELTSRGMVPKPFYHRDKHPSYRAMQDTQFTQKWG